MALRDIIGQEQALEILRNFITKNRTAHAYIFAGESGVGKKLTAINFAKTLNCQHQNTEHRIPRPRSLPDGRQAGAKRGGQNTDKKNLGSGLWTLGSEIDCCDKCPSCIKINKSIHPDVFFIMPEDGQIKINAIRTLEESLSYKSFEGNWKVAIVDEAETLNQASANAFLKTLEEPPAHSLLILISSMPEMIPATIRSRCQRVNFSSLPHNKMIGLLEAKYKLKGTKISGEQANLLSTLSCGRPGYAMSDDLIEKRNSLFDKFIQLLRGIEEKLWEDSDSVEEWFEWAQLWLRDIAVFKATGKTSFLVNQDREEEIINISKKSELKDILGLFDAFRNIKENLRFNLNEKLTLNYTYFLLNRTFGEAR